MTETLHIYARVSSSAQEEQGTSLTSQTEAGIAKAEQLGFEHIIWNEGGQSSRFEDLANRPVLRKLMLQIEEGIIKHLFVYNTDRLSRNQKTWGGIRWKMKEKQVKLHTPTGIIDLSSHLDSLLIGILSEISAYDNALRSERSQIGKLAKVKAGFWMGGPPPFGYQLNSGKLVENPAESKWLRRVYQLSLEGIPAHQIKTDLEKNGILTRRKSKSWSMGSIQKILRNEMYLGEYNYHDKKLDETVRCKCPQTVPTDLWNQVQTKRLRNLERRGQNARTENFYLLRNLMYCGHCQTPMTGRWKPKNHEYLYHCPHRERQWVKQPPADDQKWDRRRGCGLKRSLNIPRTNKIVWDAVSQTLSDPHKLNALLKDKFEDDGNFDARHQHEKRQIRRLKGELRKIEKSLSNLETEYRLGQVEQSIYERVFDNFNEVKRRIQNDLSQSQFMLVEIENTDYWLESVSRISIDFDEIDRLGDHEKRKWLTRHVDNIDVHYNETTKDHTLDVHLNIPLGVSARPPVGIIPRSRFLPGSLAGPRRCLLSRRHGKQAIARGSNKGWAQQRGLLEARRWRGWRFRQVFCTREHH